MKAVAVDGDGTAAVDTELLDEIREELISKYLEQGISRESAIREIDSFLKDGDRPQKYMEMRAYASKAKGYDLGVGEGFNYVIAFLVGIVGVSIHNWINN